MNVLLLRLFISLFIYVVIYYLFARNING